jgi:hypothetical protein
MSSNNSKRRGFALLLALGVIVVIGGLMAGAFMTSTNEYRIGRGTIETERALAVAEAGQAQLLSNWQLAWNAQIRNNGAVLPPQSYTVGGHQVTVRVTRLNDMTVLATSEVNLNPNLPQLAASRRTGMLLKLNVPKLPFQAAITTGGRSSHAGNGAVSGFDVTPADWTGCDAPGAAKAGVANDNLADVTSSGQCGSFSCVTGNPQKVQDPAAGTPEYYEDFGDFDFNDMRNEAVAASKVFNAMAGNVTINQLGPSYNADGSCNRNDPKNWGDINHADAVTACDDYFPTIYVKGTGYTATISQGSGQGILIADGNVTFNGNFTFIGPVIIKGNASTAGTGNKLVGGLMAANQGCTTSPCNSFSGNAQVSYSSCALTMALAARPVYPVVARRAWMDIY